MSNEKKMGGKLFNLIINKNLIRIKSHLKLSPEDVDSQDDQWLTPLMFAAKLWNKEIVDFLKFKWAKLELTNRYWTTALMYSIMYYNQTHKDLEIIESLITEKVLNLEDKNGITPLMVAKKHKHEDVSKFLIECGAVEY